MGKENYSMDRGNLTVRVVVEHDDGTVIYETERELKDPGVFMHKRVHMQDEEFLQSGEDVRFTDGMKFALSVNETFDQIKKL